MLVERSADSGERRAATAQRALTVMGTISIFRRPMVWSVVGSRRVGQALCACRFEGLRLGISDGADAGHLVCTRTFRGSHFSAAPLTLHSRARCPSLVITHTLPATVHSNVHLPAAVRCSHRLPLAGLVLCPLRVPTRNSSVFPILCAHTTGSCPTSSLSPPTRSSSTASVGADGSIFGHPGAQ